ILSVVCIKRVHRVYDLGEIVFCLCFSGLPLNCFESGEKQADQDRNDCDDNEEFNERECCGGISSHSAGIMALILLLHKFFVELRRQDSCAPTLHDQFAICSGNGHCAQSELSCMQKSS